MSLSQEQRRVSLSEEERKFPNHLGEVSRVPGSTHGEGGCQVHLN